MWPFFFSGDVVQEDWQFVTEGRVPLHKDEWLLSGPVKLQRPSNTLHGYIMLQHLLSHALACSFAQLMYQLCLPKRQSLPKPSLFSLPNTESPDDDELMWKSFEEWEIMAWGREQADKKICWVLDPNIVFMVLLSAQDCVLPVLKRGRTIQDNSQIQLPQNAERNLVAWLI